MYASLLGFFLVSVFGKGTLFGLSESLVELSDIGGVLDFDFRLP